MNKYTLDLLTKEQTEYFLNLIFNKEPKEKWKIITVPSRLSSPLFELFDTTLERI